MAASTLRPVAAPPSERIPREAADSAAFAPAKAPATSVSAFNGNRRVPEPLNEPVKSYAPGSPERAALKERLSAMSAERVDIPLIIGGEEIRTGDLAQTVMPHNHRHVLADWHRAKPEHIGLAIEASRAAAREWASWTWKIGQRCFSRRPSS